MATQSRDNLQTIVQQSFENQSTGVAQMREKQKEAVLAVLGGKDIFVRLPTGYGKTLITAAMPYAFDCLRRCESEGESWVLCICPLISLMMDQCRQLQSMGMTADFI